MNIKNLIPAIIQDDKTKDVLMLGYMNQDALDKTIETNQVTFYSRAKKRLWRKGETSGNTLTLKSIQLDCDSDTLLIRATPKGPTCHLGTDTCFGNVRSDAMDVLSKLEALIEDRKQKEPEGSYTTELFNAGIERIAQKVGEEGVEVALAAVSQNTERVCEEGADLLYHLFVLLNARGLTFSQVAAVLEGRSARRDTTHIFY